MYSLFRRFAAPAAVALLFFAQAAKANSVSFYTTGVFGAGTAAGTITTNNLAAAPLVVGASLNHAGTTSITVDSNTLSLGKSTLSFAFSKDETVELIDGQGNVTGSPGFGTFSVSSTSASPGDLFDGVKFTLNIYQYDPEVGSGSLYGTVKGKLQKNTSGVASTLKIVFDPNIVLVGAGNTKYTVMPNDINSMGSLAIGGGIQQTPITGTVVAPLPGVGVGGLWLLGGIGSLGGLKALRRRMGAAIA